MYVHDTDSSTNLNARDEEFQSILVHAATTIYDRLTNYDSVYDPLKQSHLKMLWDIVMLEVDRVALGESRKYSGLQPPILAVGDWGEPEDSALTSSLREAEMYFRLHYWADGVPVQTVH
jgi:hypothetical protein